MAAHDAAAVGAALGLGEEHRPWLADLAALGPPPGGARLPPAADVAALLARLAVPPEDARVILAHRPSPATAPAAWWLLERCAHLLARRRGGMERLAPWPALPPALGPAGRCFYVSVFLAALPGVRAYHRARGIPDAVSWATLADLGRHVALHRRTHGAVGLDTQTWLTLHFRGALYDLGRLQFERARVRPDDAALADAGAPFRQGDPALAIHIPEAGPLLPAACDAALARARPFFARHFPEEPYRIATCTSWLLDDQLAAYLPPEANILRFQRRFRPLPGVAWEGDAAIVQFVFRRVGAPLEALPRRTALERAVVDHLRAGHHWRIRAGWLTLP